MLIDHLGCTLSQAATDSLIQALNSPAHSHSNDEWNNNLSFSKKDSTTNRKANLKADVFDCSLFSIHKASVFGKTLDCPVKKGKPSCSWYDINGPSYNRDLEATQNSTCKQ